MLSSTVIVPLVGKLSDIYGRKVFLIGGNIIFLFASVACGAAPSMFMLIVFRAIQGIGGGMILSSVFATTGDLFPPAERIKYMGLFTGVFSIASVLGPTAGGFLTDNGGWRWIFFINVPISLVAIPAVWRNLPVRLIAPSPADRLRRRDSADDRFGLPAPRDGLGLVKSTAGARPRSLASSASRSS